jgi:hypothetical protein
MNAPLSGVAKRPLATPGHQISETTPMYFRRSQTKWAIRAGEGSQAGMANGLLYTPVKAANRTPPEVAKTCPANPTKGGVA